MNKPEWIYSTNQSVNIWSWRAELGITYRVLQVEQKVSAHVITGVAYKKTEYVGDYATVVEAREKCEENYKWIKKGE